MNTSDRTLEEEEARLAAASLAAGDPTGWFDRLYAAGAAGRVPVPWSRREPHPLLTEWAQRHHRAGAGKRAIVPGCGLGADAEYLARLGFAVTAFDVSATAIRLARRRHPDSPVEYVTADLLHPPRRWLRAFDLVTEIITVQALPRAVRRQATASVAAYRARRNPAGRRGSPRRDRRTGAWPALAAHPRRDRSFRRRRPHPAAIEMTTSPALPTEHRWRAEFHRPLGNPPGRAQHAAKHPVSAHGDAAGPPVEIGTSP